MILFNFGHNNLMGVFCLYVCYSTLRYSTWITSLVYLILPQSLTHSFKLELHLYNGFQQWLEPRSDLYTADQNYLVLCQPQTRTTTVIIYCIILYCIILQFIIQYYIILYILLYTCSLSTCVRFCFIFYPTLCHFSCLSPTLLYIYLAQCIIRVFFVQSFF